MPQGQPSKVAPCKVAGLARLARPLIVEVVTAPRARARLVDAAEDLALGRAHVRGLVRRTYGGVTVAEVHVDLGAHGVRVETTAAEQRVYQSTPRLTVTGSGFNDSAPGLNTLKWGNSLRGKGINYTIAEASGTALQLDLGEGSKLCGNQNFTARSP